MISGRIEVNQFTQISLILEAKFVEDPLRGLHNNFWGNVKSREKKMNPYLFFGSKNVRETEGELDYKIVSIKIVLIS